MTEDHLSVSRRSLLASGATLLGGFGVSATLPAARAFAAEPSPAGGAAGTAANEVTDLAQYRPVSASSTAYAATPAAFAVDRLAETGVKGTGWRAATGDPQWIAVDLQAPCAIQSIILTFEADADTPPFVPAGGGNPYANTTGEEIMSSCAVAFTIDVSADGSAWATAYQTASGAGGVTTVTLPRPVTARWVRLSATQNSNTNPLGLNGFEVYGTCRQARPPAHGWSSWGPNRRPAPPLTVAADGTVPIESGWNLTLDDWAPSSSGATLSSAGTDTGDWLPATVPGTVLGSLVEQGHLPDPAYGMNNLAIPEALSRHAWWYRRAFELPRGLDAGPGRHLWLEFDGVDDQAEVWLNGTRVGQVANAFTRGVYDVTNVLHRAGEQALALRVTPIPQPGSPGDKGPDGESFVNSDMLYLNSPTYLAASGWDWMPAVRDRGAGIWNHVRLRSTGDAVIGDPRVSTTLPNLPSTDVAEVTITVPVRNAGAGAVTVTVTAAFDDVRLTDTVTVAAGKEADVVFAPSAYGALRISEPKLWWPNGYGVPFLHELTLTTAVGAAESDRRTLRFGIRQFDYVANVPIVINSQDRATQTENFPARTARYLRIQCGTRATSWGDSMWQLSVYDSSAPGTDLALNKTATASSVDNSSDGPQNAVDGDPNTRWSSAYEDDQWIQVDLGSAVPFDQVVIVWEQAYAATYAIQTSNDASNWTDVLAVDNTPTPLKIIVNGVPVFCRGGSWGWDELLRRVSPDRMNSLMALQRDMNFTMVRNWIGTCHREEFFAAADECGLLVWNEFWDGFSEDPPDAAAYIAAARDTVLRYRTHPCIVVWFGCNEGDPPADIASDIAALVAAETDLLYQPDSNTGVITGDGPYHWLDPTGYFTGDATGGSIGFHSEIGLPTVPVVESMRNLVGSDDPGWPIGAPWYLHDWSSQGNQAPQTYQAAIQARLGTSDSLEDFCRKAQFVNYESMRAIFEAWNSRLWHNATGVLLWMSNPAWHSTVWQTYDYDLDVNGSYYGARKGCEALHVQASLADWSVLAVNHTPTARDALTVTAQLYKLDGTTLGTATKQTLEIAASSSTPAFTVAFDDSLPALHLLRLQLTNDSGELLSENTYWRYHADTDMQALNQLAPTRVTVTTSGHGTNDTLTATLRNSGPTVAAMLRLSLRDENTGDRVLPTRYSDNYFWLLPGESREVTMSWQTTAEVAPRLVVEGYNVPITTS
ncbi:discoidin domain-containing protein [Catenulispora pinisilvae]|uniref:discoidin domain-containing protein n=1 Tax=Catenulispora pinisilvae TaxID=2705253 RepID=UPI001890C809|nr:discoidin domain-containing protein [Catenulispora pinisilvae]